MPYSISVNGKVHSVDVDDDTPLLWVLRDTIGLMGTKFGCGVGMCGACMVDIDGKAVPSCRIPLTAAKGVITTIEGVRGREAKAVQAAWIARDVPQCGYCQSGQIIAATALLRTKPKPTDRDIDEAMTNICRCATYTRIRAAIHDAAKTLAGPI